jgi:Leucine Rich repeats (2 copies)
MPLRSCILRCWCAAGRWASPVPSLKALRKLSLQSNRLASMAGLQGCEALEELYLSHNGIERLEVRPAFTTEASRAQFVLYDTKNRKFGPVWRP